jgi:dTDP-4-amino-4,6-dideoxy-D-glucose acyltransferase
MDPEAKEHCDRLARMLLDHDEFIASGAVADQQASASPSYPYGFPHGLKHLGAHTDIFDYVVFTRPENIEIDDTCRIDSFVKLEGGKRLKICSYVHIASFAHINIGGGETVMGPLSCVASHGMIISGGNRPNGFTMSACAPKDQQKLEYGFNRIGAGAAVLSGAVILPGVCLGTASIAAAGAVVTKSIPDGEIWAGNPARKIGEVSDWWELQRKLKDVTNE